MIVSCAGMIISASAVSAAAVSTAAMSSASTSVPASSASVTAAARTGNAGAGQEQQNRCRKPQHSRKNEPVTNHDATLLEVFPSSGASQLWTRREVSLRYSIAALGAYPNESGFLGY